MPLTFTSSDVAADDHGIKACVYSRSGIGKTVLCATAPGPLLLAAEPGALSLQKKNLEKIFGVGNPNITYVIPMIQITSVLDLTEVHQWLQYAQEAKQFDTIYLDSVTEIAEVILSNAKAVAKDPRQAYGTLIDEMTMTIKGFRNIVGKHVVMVAKQEKSVDEISRIASYGPTMPGNKMGQAMPYLFDEVFRLGVAKMPEGKEYRFLQTQPDLQYEAKDRSGALDPVEPPDLRLVFQKILARNP